VDGGNFKPPLKKLPLEFMLIVDNIAVIVSLFGLLDGVASMPWVQILIAIASLYLLVKCVQGVRDFVVWYREGRAFAAEQKRLRVLRRQERSAGLNMPALKERPAESSTSKPPIRESKPTKGDSGVGKK
jgi:hypothetical protein